MENLSTDLHEKSLWYRPWFFGHQILFMNFKWSTEIPTVCPKNPPSKTFLEKKKKKNSRLHFTLEKEFRKKEEKRVEKSGAYIDFEILSIFCLLVFFL